MRCLTKALCLAVLSCAATAFADAPPVALPAIVVTPNKASQPELESPRSVNAVTSERARELQAHSAPEALNETTGVLVQETNRGAGAPFIRGLIGPQNLIVIDGIPFNNGTFRTGPNQYLSLLDSHAMDRIEVVRGPSSVLYGNGAMGGVINMLMPLLAPDGGDFSTETRLQARFGSADLAGGGTADITGRVGDFAFRVGGSADHFGTLRVGGGDQWPLSAYDAGYWHAKFAFAPGDLSLVGAYYGAAIRNAGRTDKLGLGEVRQYDNTDHLAYLRFQWEPGGVVDRLRATLSYHRMIETVDRANCLRTKDADTGIKLASDQALCAAWDRANFAKLRLNRDTVGTIGANAELRLALLPQKRLTVNVGVESFADTVNSSRQDAKAPAFDFKPKSRGNFSNGSAYTTLGAYAHADWTALDLTPRHLQLRLNGGLRYSRFEASAPNVPEVGDVAYQFGGLVGSAGLQLVWPAHLNIYGTFAQGFRAPNLQETTVLGNTGSKFEIPNADLRPERSDTFEVGAKGHAGPITARVAWFYSRLADAIDDELTSWQGQTDIDGTPVVRRVNTAKGVYQGIEAQVGATVWRLHLNAGLTWMTSELTRADGTTTPARRTPPLFGTVSLRYQHPHPRAYGELIARFAGPQRDLHPADLKDQRICETSRFSGIRYRDLGQDCPGSDGWVVFGVRGGWQFLNWLRADLSLMNLLDTNYRVHGSGFDGAGIDARLSLTAEL